MFTGASAFNQDISSWDVTTVTTMFNMFNGAAAFNQDISSWDVTTLTDMSSLFNGAAAFNQDIRSWEVSSVTNFTNMFNNSGITVGNTYGFTVPTPLSSEFSLTYDGTAPTMDITSDTVTSGSTTNDASIQLTFTASEATTDFVAGDITVTGGALSGSLVVDEDNEIYTIDLTPDGNVTCTVNVETGTFTDAAGNGNSAATEFSWTYDGTAPTMIISTSTSNVTLEGKSNASPVEFIFTSNEDIYDFAVEDIDATNGDISNFSGSGTTYTAEFTPTAEGECTIKVEADKFTDLAGNANDASNPFIWTYDSIAPEVDITSSEIKNGAAYNSSLTILFTISEPVLEFIIDNISVTNGTLSNLEADDTLYTATFTPDQEGTCTINISKDQFQDIYGNWNIASTEFSWTHDITPPDKPSIKFKEANLNLNYSYPIGTSVLYYRNNAIGSTSKYYNNILSIEFADDVYNWDYSTNGGSSYTTKLGTIYNTIQLKKGTYASGSIIIRNYDEATNVSSVTNSFPINIKYNLNGHPINTDNSSSKLKIAQAKQRTCKRRTCE